MATHPVQHFIKALFGRKDATEYSATPRTPLIDEYFNQIEQIILHRQDVVTGLLPASTAITNHGDYTDAWVRDNVYSILAAWGLSIAYRKSGRSKERAYLLEQSVIKLMQGLLAAMMRQTSKVERFKHTQHPIDALHAKYGTRDGLAVVGDDAWGHLQLDATSLYLLILAQMIASGLQIIASLDEVNFVQNLIHYISRAYRTPDYGIWERGHKLNHGEPELNASSIGMALAALEAMDGCNLFGVDGDQSSIVHIVPDDIARTRIALHALLPRESVSKEVDGALLSITGYPAFAVNDEALMARTMALCEQRLQGEYGYKRFLLDGHQTVIEDPHRLHYEPHELKAFAHIECEWPLFFCYRYLHALFNGEREEAKQFRSRLDSLAVDRDGQNLIPELYFVSEIHVDGERQKPGSQPRLPNDNVPLVWAQSLYLLGNMIADQLISPDDIDPLGRHKRHKTRSGAEVQIALLAENMSVKNRLETAKLRSDLREHLSPIEIRAAHELSQAYTQVGRNDRMGLTGRPLRQVRTLATARLYVLGQHPVVFVPQFLDPSGFYLALDNVLLIDRIKAELMYLNQHWPKPESRPLLLIEIHENMIEGPDGLLLVRFLQELGTGSASTAPCRYIALAEFADDTAFERIGTLHDFELSKGHAPHTEGPREPGTKTSGRLHFEDHEALGLEAASFELMDDPSLVENLYQTRSAFAWLDILRILYERHGLDYLLSDNVTLGNALEDLYLQAAEVHAWRIIRITAALLGKYDINLEQAATEILVRQHGLTLGKSYSSQSTFRKPADSSEILTAIRRYNPGNPSLQILIQELIVALGRLIKQRSGLFENMHTIRVGHILDILIAREKRAYGDSLDQAFERIMAFKPHELSNALKETLGDYALGETDLLKAERLTPIKSESATEWSLEHDRQAHGATAPDGDYWLHWREKEGSVGREDNAFFEGIFELLGHCEGLMIGGKYNAHRRIDSLDARSHMTPGEQTFKLRITHLLDRIESPAYRQLTVETLRTLSHLVKTYPELHFGDTLVTDILIGHAVRIRWLNGQPGLERTYEEDVAKAWDAFFRLTPEDVSEALVDALAHLSEESPELLRG